MTNSKYITCLKRSEGQLRGIQKMIEGDRDCADIVTQLQLINTTNSHSQLVKSQLESTDATLVEVYSAGNTDVIFTQAPLHYEILISNKHRAIREPEIETIQEFFLKRKIDKTSVDEANIKTLYSEKLIGISIPIK